jgi:hypothetical protein
MAGRLEALLNRFSVAERAFHSGSSCGINDLDDGAPRASALDPRGTVEVHSVEVHNSNVLAGDSAQPVALSPAMPHSFVTDAVRGAEMTCADDPDWAQVCSHPLLRVGTRRAGFTWLFLRRRIGGLNPSDRSRRVLL